MKREIHLVHQILAYLEAHDPTGEKTIEREEIEITGYDKKVIEAHVDLLIDKGLLVDRSAKSDRVGHFRFRFGTWLTWDGYNLLARLNGDENGADRALLI